MCLAIPGEVISCRKDSGRCMGDVQFGGIVREISLDFVPEVRVGDFVLVHVGFAISRIDREAAQHALDLLVAAELTATGESGRLDSGDGKGEACRGVSRDAVD